ncbi:MAG TPA: DUF5985 family protein [Pirellulales bacterium]|nr:DUF5985 family protein [Pirellulales bacterium]
MASEAFLTPFLQGMLAMGCLVVSLFFLRYWRGTGDRLFLIFSVAFLMLCITRVVAAAIGSDNPHNGYVYTIRFIAYLLILAAIFDKNRA